MRVAFEIVADNDEPSDSSEERRTVQSRLLEFWDVVSMSFSNSEEDRFVTTYPSFSPPVVLNRNWLWCPILSNQGELFSWMDYNQRAREAIRYGFRRGLGELSGYYQYDSFEHWVEQKEGFAESTRLMINLITSIAENDRQFLLARKRLEFLLHQVYQEGKFIPYHPEFDKTFIIKLSGLSLNDINDFLAKSFQPNSLGYIADYQYINDLLTEAAESIWLSQPSKIGRARTYMAKLKKSMHKMQIYSELCTSTPIIPSIASVCRNSFTESDLMELMVSLNVLKCVSDGQRVNYLLNGSLSGKASSKISWAYAALVELGRCGLMDLKSEDWHDVLLAEPFGIRFGKKVRNYSYKGTKGSGAYDDGIERTRKWLTTWSARQNGVNGAY